MAIVSGWCRQNLRYPYCSERRWSDFISSKREGMGGKIRRTKHPRTRSPHPHKTLSWIRLTAPIQHCRRACTSCTQMELVGNCQRAVGQPCATSQRGCRGSTNTQRLNFQTYLVRNCSLPSSGICSSRKSCPSLEVKACRCRICMKRRTKYTDFISDSVWIPSNQVSAKLMKDLEDGIHNFALGIRSRLWYIGDMVLFY